MGLRGPVMGQINFIPIEKQSINVSCLAAPYTRIVNEFLLINVQCLAKSIFSEIKM